MIAMGGDEGAVLPGRRHTQLETSFQIGARRGKNTKVKRDARKVMLRLPGSQPINPVSQSVSRSVGLAAVMWWGGMLSTKRKLILEREKKLIA